MSKKRAKVIVMFEKFAGVINECKHCKAEYLALTKKSKYCCGSCRTKAWKERRKEQQKSGLTTKRDYPKLTFRLSLIGLIGSLGFYLGVLRDLNEPPSEKDRQIEQLEGENGELKHQVTVLTELVDNEQ